MSLVHARRWFILLVICTGLTPGVAKAQPADDNPATEQPPSAQAPAETTAASPNGDEPGMTSGEVFIRRLADGGTTMIFLLLTSVIGVAVTIERSIRLKRKGIVPLHLADEADTLWRAEQFDQLKEQADASNSTLGRIVVSLVRHRRSPAADVSAMAGDIASRDLRRHLQRAYPLLVVATIAPLLGLLGTVIGMIGAFATIEALGELADPAAFGGDISKALITTGAGLGIAVPALAAYHFFKSRTSGFGVELEEVASELISEWFVLQEDKPKDTPEKPEGDTKTAKPAKPSEPQDNPPKAEDKPGAS